MKRVDIYHKDFRSYRLTQSASQKTEMSFALYFIADFFFFRELSIVISSIDIWIIFWLKLRDWLPSKPVYFFWGKCICENRTKIASWSISCMTKVCIQWNLIHSKPTEQKSIINWLDFVVSLKSTISRFKWIYLVFFCPHKQERRSLCLVHTLYCVQRFCRCHHQQNPTYYMLLTNQNSNKHYYEK